MRFWLAPGDVTYLDLLEANWRNLSEKADVAYELGLLEEAEVLDEAAEVAAEWLECTVAGIEEEGGDLDIRGGCEGIEPGPEEMLAEFWRRLIYWQSGTATVFEGIGTREELVEQIRGYLKLEPGARHDISDDLLVEAARDAYESREEYKRRLKQPRKLTHFPARSRRRKTARENPPAWVTDEEAWERAYDAVEPYWENYDEPWAVVTFVYKRIVAAKERRARSERARKAAKARWKKAKAKKKRKR
jgi:hypothetical protein